MHILLTNVHLDCRGRVPVTVTGMLTGMNLSKPGMNMSKPDESVEAGEKHNNHVIIIVYPYFHTGGPFY